MTIMKILNPLCIVALALTFQLNAQELEIKPIFKDGEAQVVSEFENPENWIRHDLWVETDFDSDGDGDKDRMHVSVTRPEQTEQGLKLPVIYATSPYYAGTAGFVDGLFYDVRHNLGETPPERTHTEVIRRGKRPIISNSEIYKWLPRGYIVVHSSSPGTGLSEGAPTVGGDNESLAPKAVIEWLTGKRKGFTSPDNQEEIKAFWSSGKIGMTGTSYNGTLPIAAATTGVDGLEAIIPIAPNTSYYHYYRSNGLVRSPGGYLGEDVDVLYDFIHSGEPTKRARNNKVIRDSILAMGIDRVTGDYNEFWAERDYLNDMEDFKTALFMAHGFNDWNVMPEHSYRIYNAAREKGLPVKIYYHQDGHGGPPPFSMMNQWFTKYLHGEENGAEDGPKAWIVRENDTHDKPTPYPDYPNPRAKEVMFSLGAGGEWSGTLNIRDQNTNVVETLVDNFSFSGSNLAQAEYSNHRLLYLTDILKEDIHISGIPSINIKMASSKPAANLSVWLVSLPWNKDTRIKKAKITDNIITRGWADPQNYKSLTESESLKPGKFYKLSFTLQPDDQIIKAGQQIGLMIFSTDREFTLWPDPGTELSIDLDETKLRLPIVGGKKAFENSIMTKAPD